jgi:hypothetical protein
MEFSLILLIAGCAAPVPPPWATAPSRVVEPRANISDNRPLKLRVPEFGFLDYGLPSSAITVLRDGVPAPMRATVLALVAAPPEGRDGAQTRSVRILLVWTADGETEGFYAAGTHFPAEIRPLPEPCCSDAQQSERRWLGRSVLDVRGEAQWHAARGTVTIAPPWLDGACSDSLRHVLAQVSEGTASCRRAEFEVTLDASYQQPPSESIGAARTRAMAPVRMRGVQVLLDCGRPNGKFDAICGSQR